MIALPESPNDLAQAPWEEIAPHYERLAEQPLDDVDSWLREWSRFEEILSEAYALAAVAYTCDTTDSAKEAANLRFARDIRAARPRAERPFGPPAAFQWLHDSGPGDDNSADPEPG